MVSDFEEFLSKVNFDSLKRVKSKVAYVWILGEFGEQVEAGPYIIERMITVVEEHPNTQLSLSILEALMKLFFIRAPEVKEMLGWFFKYIINDCSDVDMKEWASFYYKLLKTNPDVAQNIISKDRESTSVDQLYDDEAPTLQEQLQGELNTLSIVYNKPQENFLKEDVLKTLRKAKKHRKVETTEGESTQPLIEEEEEAPEEEKAQEADLIDFGDPVDETPTSFDPLDQ